MNSNLSKTPEEIAHGLINGTIKQKDLTEIEFVADEVISKIKEIINKGALKAYDESVANIGFFKKLIGKKLTKKEIEKIREDRNKKIDYFMSLLDYKIIDGQNKENLEINKGQFYEDQEADTEEISSQDKKTIKAFVDMNNYIIGIKRDFEKNYLKEIPEIIKKGLESKGIIIDEDIASLLEEFEEKIANLN